jgi:predicted O-methyltransferase YrrM
MIPRQDAMLQCYQVPGQMWPTELGCLYDTFQHSSNHAEIGTYCGRSLLATCLGMSVPNANVLTVDVNLDSPIGRSWVSSVRAATLEHIRRVTSVTVWSLEMLSIDAARYCHEHQHAFDSVFIDGDHNYAECLADIEVWSALLRPGGIISGHDYWPRDVGVMDAVSESFHGRFTVVPGTRIWIANV